MSGIISRLKAYFFQPNLLGGRPNLLVGRRGLDRRTLWYVFVLAGVCAGGAVMGVIIQFFENPTNMNILTTSVPAVLTGFFLLYAAELVARVRIGLAGILRIAAYLLYGIAGISLLIWLIGRL